MAAATVPALDARVPLKSVEIEVVSGPDRGVRCQLKNERIAVGTAAGNDLRLTDAKVSRYHLELAHAGDRIEVRDLGSTNGTLSGAVRIAHAWIDPGSVIRLGDSAVRVEGGEAFDLDLLDADHLGAVVGRSVVMRKVMADAKRVAPSDASVLLLGETGTGKEVFARAIHELSKRSAGPFETVDCGALTPTLVASELFGHERGAFTGADRQHAGAFERANGGTVFLDEIGEIPAALQTSLLGVIERRSIRRLGGDQPRAVDVRIICATNRDLRSEVNSGAFRADLYYRIAIVTLRLPPLRERIEDIGLLVERFLRESGFNGPPEDVLPEAVLDSLRKHAWPGNIRELRNFVEAALAFGHAPELEPPAANAKRGADWRNEALSVAPDDLARMSYKDARQVILREFELWYLRRLLETTNDNVSAAARVSDIHRSYLNDMLKRHRLR